MTADHYDAEREAHLDELNVAMRLVRALAKTGLEFAADDAQRVADLLDLPLTTRNASRIRLALSYLTTVWSSLSPARQVEIAGDWDTVRGCDGDLDVWDRSAAR